MRKLKKATGFLHLWLGLISGLIITIVAFTGCIYVFEEELFNFFHKEIVYTPAEGNVLPLEQLKANAQVAIGAKEKINSVEVKPAPYSYLFSATKANKKSTSWFYFPQVKYDKDVYVDPYTGKVLGVINRKYEFFNVIRQTHQFLLFKKAIGSVIVGSAVLIFLFIIITGFIIWLPKKMKNLKQRLSIKWGAKFKRVNYDWHSTLGFYAIPFLLIIVVTGLVWSFKWWELGVFKTFGMDKKPVLSRTFVPSLNEIRLKTAENTALDTVIKLNKGNYSSIVLNFPSDEKTNMLAIVTLKNSGDVWKGMSYYYFNPETGMLTGDLLHKNKPLGQKWRNSNLEIHAGKLFGWPHKILAFFVSLICATLPVTGFLIYYGRTFGKKKLKVTRRS